MVHADSQSVRLQISAPAGFDAVNGILRGSAAVTRLCLQSTTGQRLGEPQPSAVISTPLNTPWLPRSHCLLLGKGHYSSLIGHVASHLRPDGACLCHPLWLEWRARCVCCSHLGNDRGRYTGQKPGQVSLPGKYHPSPVTTQPPARMPWRKYQKSRSQD